MSFLPEEEIFDGYRPDRADMMGGLGGPMDPMEQIAMGMGGMSMDPMAGDMGMAPMEGRGLRRARGDVGMAGPYEGPGLSSAPFDASHIGPPGYEDAMMQPPTYSNLSLAPPNYQYPEYPQLNWPPTENFDNPAAAGPMGGLSMRGFVDQRAMPPNFNVPEMINIGGEDDPWNAGIEDERMGGRGRMRQTMSRMGFTGRSEPIRTPFSPGYGPYYSEGYASRRAMGPDPRLDDGMEGGGRRRRSLTDWLRGGGRGRQQEMFGPEAEFMRPDSPSMRNNMGGGMFGRRRMSWL